MACDLVTNFGVALMKKLWQCSVLSSTLRVAVPSLASHLRENGKSANRNAHQNRETEVFWHKKIEKPVQKNSQNRKTENPNAPPPPSHSKDAQQ